LLALGHSARPSTSATGARSIVNPAAAIRAPTRAPSARICWALIVRAMSWGQGHVPTTLLARITPPPSSSLMTAMARCRGCSLGSRWSVLAKSSGAVDPNTKRPPNPSCAACVMIDVLVAVTDTTTTSRASWSVLHELTIWVAHCSAVEFAVAAVTGHRASSVTTPASARRNVFTTRP